jgi:adenylate kinase family enzyme
MTARIAILGNSGSGKSTLAQAVAARLGAEVLDLDTVAWQPGEVAVPRAAAEARADLEAFCGRCAAWVAEGCYGELIAALLPRAPLLVFLEPGEAACVAHCRARPWEPHKYASRAEQEQRLGFLLEWVAGYYTRGDSMSLRAHRALYEGYAGRKCMLQRPGQYLEELEPWLRP